MRYLSEFSFVFWFTSTFHPNLHGQTLKLYPMPSKLWADQRWTSRSGVTIPTPQSVSKYKDQFLELFPSLSFPLYSLFIFAHILTMSVAAPSSNGISSASIFTSSIENVPSKQPAKIIIPDLVSHCTFDIKINRHHKQATAESKKWLFRGGNLNPKKRQAFHGLKAGLLTSMCYPDADCPQLRVCCDFMNYLFHLDDLSDDMDNRGTKTTADVVLNSLYHPYSYHPLSKVGKMTIE